MNAPAMATESTIYILFLQVLNESYQISLEGTSEKGAQVLCRKCRS